MEAEVNSEMAYSINIIVNVTHTDAFWRMLDVLVW